MLKRMLAKSLVSLGLMAVAMFASACNGKTAAPEEMTGQAPHERHTTGMESQVGDY
ncbi:MAG: hypothetical protein GY842_04700 [bacterium]|nr:hypothetical protein [bacterium]